MQHESDANAYLSQHNIHDTLRAMLALLVAEQPADPRKALIEFLTVCREVGRGGRVSSLSRRFPCPFSR